MSITRMADGSDPNVDRGCDSREDEKRIVGLAFVEQAAHSEHVSAQKRHQPLRSARAHEPDPCATESAQSAVSENARAGQRRTLRPAPVRGEDDRHALHELWGNSRHQCAPLAL
jgi:hypothetical protein